MKYMTAGNSHGKCLLGILSGFPYGFKISENYIRNQLEGRRNILGRGIRQKIEDDNFEIISGLDGEITDGNPIGAIIYNKNTKLKSFSYFTPGYGDLIGAIKHSHTQTYLVKERASARESAIRVLLFSFTKKFLEELGIKIEHQVIKCHKETDDSKFQDLIKKFQKEGDSFGGVFEVRVKNLPVGLGGYENPEDRLQSKISKELFSLGGIKSVEFGKGLEIIEFTGKELNKNQKMLGGIQCGMTDGSDILIRCATRPISSVRYPQKTTDLKTGKEKEISTNSSDVTSVFASAYISVFLISYVIAEEVIKKFGSDNFKDIEENLKQWRIKTNKKLKNIKGL